MNRPHDKLCMEDRRVKSATNRIDKMVLSAKHHVLLLTAKDILKKSLMPQLNDSISNRLDRLKLMHITER